MAFKREDRTPTWSAIVAAAKAGCGFIMLPRREHALVDEDVMDTFGGLQWHRIPSGYVVGNRDRGQEWLHKTVAGHNGQVDHKDRNKLNCQRSNLRPCTQSQNSANTVKLMPKTSQFKGVYFDKWSGRFKAAGTVNYKTKHLGRFDDERDAAAAYNAWASQTFGEFACLNQLLPNGQFCPVGGGEVPVNISLALAQTIPRSAVAIHRVKGRSLIDLLLTGQYVH